MHTINLAECDSDLRLDGEDVVAVAEELVADGVAGGLVADVVA